MGPYLSRCSYRAAVLTHVTENDLKKKGRKPKSDNYFDQEEELAVRLYLSATTFEEKNKIYKRWQQRNLS